MDGVLYENRHRQNDVFQFSTERAEQENESINPYMEDTDFNEKAFDMIGPNAPQEVKDAWMEAAKEVNANGMGIKKNGICSEKHRSSEGLYERERILCRVSGKIGKVIIA